GIPANTKKIKTNANLTVIFYPKTNVLSETKFLRITAIIFPQPKSQQTTYSPLRTIHKLYKNAKITNTDLYIHDFPTEKNTANNILNKT
ncbi:hypothetical protein RHO81_25530, partial [Salmonella enterica subsp. enterica serovar Typhimurium]|nr:hypothetical protein [Salmonella enterica subsp. enterica serovar Typhimurium]